MSSSCDDISVVDSHFHIWELKKFAYDFPTPDLAVLYRDCTINDLEEAVKDTPVKHGVYVQVPNGGKSAEEAEWITSLAEKHPFISGMVAGFGLDDPQLPSLLDRFQDNPLVKGVRSVIDFVEQDDWILKPEVQEGVALVGERHLRMDVLTSARHWPHVYELVKKHPSVPFLINHLGKPVHRLDKRPGWKEWISKMASCPNVHCKISSQCYAHVGEPTEAEKQGIFTEQDREFVQYALDVFGADRCMYGSDWPVSLLDVPSYAFYFNMSRAFFKHLTPAERRKVYADNCIKFYDLHIQ